MKHLCLKEIYHASNTEVTNVCGSFQKLSERDSKVLKVKSNRHHLCSINGESKCDFELLHNSLCCLVGQVHDIIQGAKARPEFLTDESDMCLVKSYQPQTMQCTNQITFSFSLHLHYFLGDLRWVARFGLMSQIEAPIGSLFQKYVSSTFMVKMRIDLGS